MVFRVIITIKGGPIDQGLIENILLIASMVQSNRQSDYAEASVESALKSRVRLIDTANGCMNESGTGRSIKKSGIKREGIFLVTKLWLVAHGL